MHKQFLTMTKRLGMINLDFDIQVDPKMTILRV